MLFKRSILDGIAAGKVTLAFRRWKRIAAKAGLKINIRKLKDLGLTESLEVGYRLSPRGRAFLERQERRQ